MYVLAVMLCHALQDVVLGIVLVFVACVGYVCLGIPHMHCGHCPGKCSSAHFLCRSDMMRDKVRRPANQVSMRRAS